MALFQQTSIYKEFFGGEIDAIAHTHIITQSMLFVEIVHINR